MDTHDEHADEFTSDFESAAYWRRKAEHLERLNAELRGETGRPPAAVKELRNEIDVRRLSLAERKPVADDIHITRPRLSELRDMMFECQASYGEREPKCMFTFGAFGVGKSRLYEKYLGLSVREPRREGTRLPILAATLEKGSTLKATASALLRQLGDPHWDRGTKGVLYERVKGLIIDCEVHTLVFDEFHNLLQSESAKSLTEAAGWLSNLIFETRVPVLAFGRRSGLQVLKVDGDVGSLGRRFVFREELKPFAVDSAASEKEFAGFLHLVDLSMPLAERSNLGLGDLPHRIHEATNGIVYWVMLLLREAAWRAVNRGGEAITRDDLAWAFSRYLATGLEKAHNPFAA